MNTARKIVPLKRAAEITTVMTTDEMIDRYMAYQQLKPKSEDTYRKALKQFRDYLSAKQIGEPTRQDILNYRSFLMERYTPCTVSSYLTPVKGLYQFLEAENVTKDITRGIKGAKHQNGFKKDALTIEQAKDLLGDIDTSTLDGKRNYALVNLLIRTGLRTVEVERANIEDIRQQGGEALLYIQGKGRDSKDAFVLLTEAALKPIRAYLKLRGKADQKDPLFISHSDRNNGGRLTTRSISRIVKESLRDAGIDSERLTAHSLRHSAVTFSLLAGASIQETQSLARHKNINTTMIYAHNIDRIKKAPERKIDELLK
jgi:integrase/recombinase XerD